LLVSAHTGSISVSEVDAVDPVPSAFVTVNTNRGARHGGVKAVLFG